MQNILVVEDDYDLNQAICYSLKKSGYGVYGVTFMEKGKQIFFENQNGHRVWHFIKTGSSPLILTGCSRDL